MSGAPDSKRKRGKKRLEKAERAKKHTEYLREKKRKEKERKVKRQAPVKIKKKR
jgi:hypothetical protein